MQRRRLVFSPLPIPIPFRSPVNRKQRDLKTAIWNRDRRENHFPGGGRRLDITIFFRYDSCERSHRFHRDCPCIQGVEHEAKRIFSPAIDYHRPPTVSRDRRLKSLSPARLGWSTLGSRSVQDKIKSRRCKSRRVEKRGETFVKTKASRTIFNVGTRTRVFIPPLPPLRSVLRSRNTSRVYRPAPIPSSSPVGRNRGNAKMPPAMRPRSRIYGRRIRTNKSQFLRL